MPSPTDQPNWQKEFLGSFLGGMDGNTDPMELDRNQLAFAENLTVRTSFIHPRPAHRLISFSFNGVTPSVFLTQLFQSAAVYRNDYGITYLMAWVGGRLYKIVITGTTSVVSEIPIQGEASPAQPVAVPQTWMWQSEKWMISENGQNLPIFWDDTTARRSDGSIVRQVGVLSGAYIAAAIGQSAVANLVANYIDKLNIVVQILNATGTLSYGLFQVISAASTNSTYLATFLNVDDTPGNAIPVNAQFIVPAQPGKTNLLGVVKTRVDSAPSGQLQIAVVQLVNPIPSNLIPGGVVHINGPNSGPLGILGPPGDPAGATSVTLISNAFAFTLFPGDRITVDGTVPGPTNAYPVGIVVTAAVVPAVGATVDVQLDRAYTGASNFPVVLSTSLKNYQVTPKAGTVGVNQVNLINLSSTFTTGPGIPATAVIKTVQELPAGRMGVYGLGRNWLSLTDGRSFIGSDIVGGPSGTPAYQFRDAPLRVTENAALVGGSPFAVPGTVGDIRAMIFATTLDASLGQGPLQVFTANSVFSCVAPTIADRLTWATITNPIVTQSLIGSGALGQDSTFAVNGDTMFRSPYGLGDLILGRREFATWGNVPISREVDSILSTDDRALLPFGSGVEFDNRALQLAGTLQTPIGVVFQKIVVLNFDPISSLRGKAPSVYDGVWTGLNILKILKGTFNNVDRCYAFCLDPGLTQIQLYELMKSSDSIPDDGGFPIVWEGQSASLFNRDVDPRQRKFYKLENGEIFVDDLVGTVIFELFYKPDQYPGWVPWHTWSETQTVGAQPEFRPRMGIGTPSQKNCDPTTQRPLPFGYTFQIRWRITGQCTFKGLRCKAVEIPEPEYAPMNCNPVVFPPGPPPAPPVPPPPNIVFSNTTPIVILDNAPANLFPSSIVVSGPNGVTITKVIVNIVGLQHTSPHDIQIILVAPSGTKLNLMSSCGDALSVSGVNLTFDDSAAISLTAGALSTGTYKPTVIGGNTQLPTGPTLPYSLTLSAFNGQSSAGSWDLYVYDRAAFDSGIIAGGWSLTIT